jgi:hypothetical protein
MKSMRKQAAKKPAAKKQAAKEQAATEEESYHAELYLQEGAQFRSVRVSVRADGSIRLDAQDMGEYVEQVWGDDDYEFWVDVPSTAIRKLVFALLRDRYIGRRDAVDEFGSALLGVGRNVLKTRAAACRACRPAGR